ncbi:MAG: MFS transporter [Candidatus Kapaibacterium sp.]
MTHNPATRAERIGWYAYDWANSAFSATVIAVFIGPYLTDIAHSAADADGFIHPLGIAVKAASYFPYLISLSVFLQVFFLPVLGAIADYSHLKKQFLAGFAYLGAFSTMGLYFLEGSNYVLGGILFVLANLSFGASVVFYNAYLSEISPPEKRDAVSSIGWGMGYLGGGILLALNLFLFSKAADFGISKGHAVRISLSSAGLWWAIFTLVPLFTLKSRQAVKHLKEGQFLLSVGFKQLFHTIKSAKKYPQTMLFLGAYLLYNDGVQTAMSMAATFGQEELHLGLDVLTTVILMVQFVAFFGALFFNYIAKITSGKTSIMLTLAIWIGTLIYAHSFLHTEGQFYILGAAIALVLGGSQALSRSVFSLMIPKGSESEYFSLYEISERGTSWLGPLLFGLALQFTGSYRIAIVSLVVFFVLGLGLLSRVNVAKAQAEAGN